jgi:Tfp pilus assembly protein PilX
MVMSALPRTVVRRIRDGGPTDRGDIVLGWLVRVVAVLALLGLFVFEGLSLVAARVSGTDAANQIALEASEAYLNHNGSPAARTKAAGMAAHSEAGKHAAEIITNSIKVQKDGTVHLRIRRTATTLFLYRTKHTAALAVIESEGNARSVAS